MNAISLIVFAFSCCFIAYLLTKIFIVFPAWKRYKMQKEKTILSKCINKLNSDILPTAKIKNGNYLHDRFYRLVFDIYTKGSPKISPLYVVKRDEEIEKNSKKFRAEIEALDATTKSIIHESMIAVNKILFLNNPVRYPIMILKITRESVRSNKEKLMVRNAEYLTVAEGEDAIMFRRECHA